MGTIKTVKVPPQFEEIFSKSEEIVAGYFKDKKEDATKGMITISDERYIMVRAASMCKAAGNPYDRFIMAHPSKIKEYIDQYMKSGIMVGQKKINYEIPGFFLKKMQEEEIRVKNMELERINKLTMGRELKVIELKKEIEEFKKK